MLLENQRNLRLAMLKRKVHPTRACAPGRAPEGNAPRFSFRARPTEDGAGAEGAAGRLDLAALNP